MVASTHYSEALAHVPGVDRLVSMYSAFIQGRAQRVERARIIRELSAYADHELLDLGIGPGDIIAVAEGKYQGRR